MCYVWGNIKKDLIVLEKFGKKLICFKNKDNLYYQTD